MDFKLFGSILLIVGTSIGAGMLALPIATAQLGFLGSIILLISCWLLMTFGAFLLLEINLAFPLNSNLISMAKGTLGPLGQVFAWITYLLLLYSLLCAYIAGGSDLFHHLLLKSESIDIPTYYSALVFALVFGMIVYAGIRVVDYVNRGLMFVKFGAFFLLIALLIPSIRILNLGHEDLSKLSSISAITVTITSFGYAAIVPSLRIYFNGDVAKLKKAIFIGSIIPLICYIAWDAVIMGVIPYGGDNGLHLLVSSQNPTSDLVTTLTQWVSQPAVNVAIKLFTSICVLTSFLGVALCLVDFLADGLHLQKSGASKLVIHLLTFLPPLIIVIFFPNVFIKALEYAGIYCVLLLIFLPAAMVWRGRYQFKLNSNFKVIGGKFLLLTLMILSVVLIIKSIL